MTGTLGANTMWDQMPFMAGLKLVRKALMPTGIQHMELKVDVERLPRATVLGAPPSPGSLPPKLIAYPSS
jgi:hypothetical protein